jgi:hypothetical protein
MRLTTVRLRSDPERTAVSPELDSPHILSRPPRSPWSRDILSLQRLRSATPPAVVLWKETSKNSAKATIVPLSPCGLPGGVMGVAGIGWGERVSSVTNLLPQDLVLPSAMSPGRMDGANSS